MNKRFKVYGSSALVAVLVIGGFWIHQQNELSGNQSKIHTENVSAQHLSNKRRHLTVKSVKKRYDTSEPNLDNVTKQTSKQVSKGLSLAYNNCHSDSDFKHNKSAIKKYLGADVGGHVLGIVQPQAIQDTNKDQSMSNSLTNCIISYGEFNDNDETIPMTIYVTYTTPAYDNYAGGGGQHSDKPTVHHGTSIFNVSLNVQSKSLEFNSQQNKIK